MRASSQMQRSLAHMTLDLARRMDARDDAVDDYRLREIEHQYQFPISGKVGTYPVEITVKTLFTVQFLWDPGVLRDSQLSEPMYRGGVHLESGPPGTITYNHVGSWIQDESFNYVGANVVVGVYNPMMVMENPTVVDTSFRGLLHCAFQGYGAPIDPDDGMVMG